MSSMQQMMALMVQSLRAQGYPSPTPFPVGLDLSSPWATSLDLSSLWAASLGLCSPWAASLDLSSQWTTSQDRASPWTTNQDRASRWATSQYLACMTAVMNLTNNLSMLLFTYVHKCTLNYVLLLSYQIQ